MTVENFEPGDSLWLPGEERTKMYITLQGSVTLAVDAKEAKEAKEGKEGKEGKESKDNNEFFNEGGEKKENSVSGGGIHTSQQSPESDAANNVNTRIDRPETVEKSSAAASNTVTTEASESSKGGKEHPDGPKVELGKDRAPRVAPRVAPRGGEGGEHASSPASSTSLQCHDIVRLANTSAYNRSKCLTGQLEGYKDMSLVRLGDTGMSCLCI